MPWIIQELTFGWPPSASATFVRSKGDKETLHPFFVFLEDKRVLTHGYGLAAGVTDLYDLSGRIDDLRDEIRPVLTALRPDAEISEWIRKLSAACDELLTKTYEAAGASISTANQTPESEIVPAVDQLRDAFRTTANHVWAIYNLPAAQSLARRIDAAAPAPLDRGD